MTELLRTVGQGLTLTVNFLFGGLMGAMAALLWLAARKAEATGWMDTILFFGLTLLGGVASVWLLGKLPRLI